MPPEKPIVILATRSRTSYTLINRLARRHTVATVIFQPKPYRKMLRYRLRKLGRWRVLQQLLFMVYDRVVIQPRSKAMIDALLADYDDTAPDGRLECIDVDSINSKAVQDVLKAAQPGCVVVSGTGIIGKTVLGLAPVFLNVHVGITPRYRGVHGGFWAIYENRPDLVGVTVHKIDPGVDTGDIVAQDTLAVQSSDTLRTLAVRQYLLALPLLDRAVADALDGTLQSYQREDLTSKQWYSPTPAAYLKFRQNLRRLVRGGGVG